MYVPMVIFYTLLIGGFVGWVIAVRNTLKVGNSAGRIETLEMVAVDRREEIRRLQQLVEAEVEKTVLLLQQNQNFAQSLATLRVNRGALPDETSFDPPKEEKPYSEGLMSFLSRLEHSESRRLVEEEIEFHRASGKSDEQILDIIRSM